MKRWATGPNDEHGKVLVQMSDYTPSTIQVRDDYAAAAGRSIIVSRAAGFDRWLALHDAAVRDECARTVEALNAQYRDRDGLDGQRGFSVEAAAAIRTLDKRA